MINLLISTIYQLTNILYLLL